jgi:citrate lyase subunit beta/citryl-CoA lyase
MSIDVSELEDACAIVLKAYNADWGPIQHEGNLHDRATFRYFWEVIQRARLQGEQLPDEVVSTFFSDPVGAA